MYFKQVLIDAATLSLGITVGNLLLHQIVTYQNAVEGKSQAKAFLESCHKIKSPEECTYEVQRSLLS